MPMSKADRRARQQSQRRLATTIGPPERKDLVDGIPALRREKGVGLVEYIKDKGKLYRTVKGDPKALAAEVASQIARTVATVNTGDAISVSANDHGSLLGLTDDDHAHYVLTDGTRAFSDDWTNAGNTVADLGTVTTANIDGGTIDGVGINGSAIGATSHTTIKGTTIDATTDFTIGTTVITDDSIVMTPSTSDTVTLAAANNGVLNITTVDAAGAGAHINVTSDGDINLDSGGSVFFGAVADDIDIGHSDLNTSMFTGSGWGIREDGNKYSAYIDDLWVRGRMFVWELVINQIRATNGSLIVTSAAKLSSAALIGGE